MRIDLTNQRISMILVLNVAYIDKRHEVFWNCICDCGKKFIRSRRTLRSKLSKVKSCGCHVKELSRISIKKIQGINKKPDGEAAKNRVIRGYKRGATTRKLEWNISNEIVESLFNSPCYYCGTKYSCSMQEAYGPPYLYNGIDRVNNNLGYTKDNIVSCCKNCNRAKSDLTIEDFENWLGNIRSYNGTS